MKTCFKVTVAGHDIRLGQTGKNRFLVVYGKQVKSGMSYSEAACELGQCIMHAAACEGKLDNTGED